MADLKQLKAEIAELERYKAEQEQLIELATQAGNDRLRELSHEVEDLTAEREELLRQNFKVKLETQHMLMVIIDLESSVVMQQDKLDRAEALYRSTVSKFRDDIRDIREEQMNLLSVSN